MAANGVMQFHNPFGRPFCPAIGVMVRFNPISKPQSIKNTLSFNGNPFSKPLSKDKAANGVDQIHNPFSRTVCPAIEVMVGFNPISKPQNIQFQ